MFQSKMNSCSHLFDSLWTPQFHSERKVVSAVADQGKSDHSQESLSSNKIAAFGLD